MPRSYQAVLCFQLTSILLTVFAASTLQAQTTILSNESLQNATLMVNKTFATASCLTPNCAVRRPMFAPLTLQCPATDGQTCTFHVTLTAQVHASSFSLLAFRFLVDNAGPSPGPTTKNGTHTFGESQSSNITTEEVTVSIDAVVTNSGTTTHSIGVGIACQGTNGKGCSATTEWSELKVEVYLP